MKKILIRVCLGLVIIGSSMAGSLRAYDDKSMATVTIGQLVNVTNARVNLFKAPQADAGGFSTSIAPTTTERRVIVPKGTELLVRSPGGPEKMHMILDRNYRRIQVYTKDGEMTVDAQA